MHNRKFRKLVVKDNALVSAAYRLTLAEQRLILLAIIDAREMGLEIDEKHELEIKASSYQSTFNVSRQAAYMALKEAAETLMKRRFSYSYVSSKNNLRFAFSAWVQYIDYSEQEASVKLIFATKVIPLICKLEKQFTSYELAQVAELTSAYAIRLYELLMQWKSAKKTPFLELIEFRKKLGVEDNEYLRMHHFKARVLDAAVSQINSSTDILANYEQHKAGRNIIGFSFTFSYKKDAQAPISKRCGKTIDFIDEQNLTAKQLGYYAKLLSQSHWATQAKVLQGVNSCDTVSVLMSYLKEPVNFEKLKDLITDLVKKDKEKR